MHVKIESEGHGKAKVFLDGEELKGVLSINAYLGVRELTTVNIELIANTIEFDLKGASVEKNVKENE